jgi:hypothetical protein
MKYKTLSSFNNMPITRDAAVQSCLLTPFRMHTNLELVEYAAECIFQLGCKNVVPYVLLSNICTAIGKWDNIKTVRESVKDTGIKRDTWMQLD